MAPSRAPSAAGDQALAPDQSADASGRTPAYGHGHFQDGVQAGYWMVDPGIHKQSQDWIYAGPTPRHASPPRISWWPAAAAAALAAVTYLLAGLSALLVRRPPLLAGLLAAAVLFTVVAVWRLIRRGADRRRAVGGPAVGAQPSQPDGGPAAYDPNMTYTEAAETVAAARAAAAAETANGLAAATGVPEDDLRLSDEEAGRRQSWEGEIAVDPPTTWPDRPIVVAIGDGVSSALRSAEISRLATRTAWHRTFYHLHALGSGAPPATAKPWLAIPPGWPAPGPDRDRLLVRALSRGFADANSAVIMAGKEHRRQDPTETRPTATTLTLLAVDGMRYFLVHVGDCSAYHVHGDAGEVEPRQVEHNRAAAYAQLDPAHYAQRYEEARRKGMQNVLIRWVGMTPDWTSLDPQVLQPAGELVPGDALVLCSDGLDKHVDHEGIGRAAVALDAEAATRRLVGWANDRGGSDHIAVAVLHTRRRGSPVPARARWALWREEVATAWQRYRPGIVGLPLAGAVAAILVAAAVLLAGKVLPTPGAPVPAATAFVPATPLTGSPAPASAAPAQQPSAPAIPTTIPTVAVPTVAIAAEATEAAVSTETDSTPPPGES